ncbi:hypothetical protein HQ346_21490 [Rhodococcus sp. BP-252]|uniref:hypothetical protein n=1 Tax=unclassified Rhodococcus (in: high G+C Gram-positive bacteria) TaxID=192944 RepID=UPI001C9BBBF9|nr:MULTISPECIES: hypothetical protein [unclassified Rhodococcus (in: high G+C Gram-positive bacteria)]MBY6414274.1 hypothetical protein [Rhodococcus sp. BP-320]MBY6419073.1 hypothetical protein [Rhodococcus sp. BP-321]MBY6423741.1 hypothetical protein [Rhodococcus sp. BP-324]MBY6429107.1 hypothetical protein [Rhodococcus sp. BP-323]MBY6434113.1 hypothetical protein [Rhodococcus sp. BP-322]
MTNSDEQVTHWQSLALAADNGHLYLNEEAARACSAACTHYIAKLTKHQEQAMVLADVKGLGEFESGKALRDKFSKKAFGGDNNLVDVLQSHIEVVERMRVVFNKFFDATTRQDEMNATALNHQGPS